MVVILVILTAATILTLEWYLSHRRQLAAQVVRARSPMPAGRDKSGVLSLEGFLFHPGHTWVRVHEDGLASVGVTDFAANFAGDVCGIELPNEGDRLQQGQPAWTLVSARKRHLQQLMPIDGRVLAINRDLLRDPDLAQRDPYEAGWILRVRPRNLPSNLSNLLPARAARAWIDATRARIAAQLNPSLGSLAYDGGEWAAGFGDRIEDPEWEELRQDLFPASEVDRQSGRE
jgi:glycine cleavage system H protein